MDAVTFIASGADDPAKGYAGPIALAAAVFACYLIWRADMWWKARQPPSPTEAGAPLPRETPQVKAVSSHVSPDETPGETKQTDWWGSIEKVNGSLRRVWRRAGHIAQTGDSPPPDDELDLPLDDGAYDADHGGGGSEVEFVENGELPVAAASIETREEYVTRCIEADVPKPKIVAALQEHYGLSRATAYRVVDGAAERRPAA